MPRLLLGLALLCLAACAQDDVERGADGRLQLGREQVTEVTERNVGLGDRTLVLDVDAGSISVSGTDETEARLRFVCVARGTTKASARARLERLTIEEAGDGEIYQYVARANDLESIRVNVQAFVPRNASLNLRTDRGEIRLSGAAGPVRAKTENGSIEAAGLGGREVKLGTELGAIAAGFATLPNDAEVEIEAENGNITITVPPEASVDFKVRTETGNVAAQELTFASQRLEEDEAGTSFEARLGAGDADVSARTEVGNVVLRGGLSLVLDLAADTTTVSPGAPVAPSDD